MTSRGPFQPKTFYDSVLSFYDSNLFYWCQLNAFKDVWRSDIVCHDVTHATDVFCLKLGESLWALCQVFTLEVGAGTGVGNGSMG